MSTSAEPVARPEVVPGKRIFLSHVLPSDAPALARWFADLELTAYLGRNGMSFTEAQERQWIDGVNNDSSMRHFAIIVREGQRFVGNVSLMHINHQRGTAELGIAIGDKDAWGKGYGSEAVRLMCAYGFAFLDLFTICLWHTSFNQRGHHAYLKAGFVETGRWPRATVFNGQRYDHILMTIDREQFGPSPLASMIGQLAHNE